MAHHHLEGRDVMSRKKKNKTMAPRGVVSAVGVGAVGAGAVGAGAVGAGAVGAGADAVVEAMSAGLAPGIVAGTSGVSRRQWPYSVMGTSLGHAALDDARELYDDVTGGTMPTAPVEPAGGDRVGDVYQNLMAREQRVLDTVDRVVNDASRRRRGSRGSRKKRAFLNLTVHQVGVRTIAAARGLLDDLVAVRKPVDLYNALLHPERAVYLGVMLLLLAMCVAFVNATTAA